MKTFLLGLLINALGLYVIIPIFITGIMAWLWVPLFFESSFSFLIGIVITALTSLVAGVVEYKLDNY